VSVRRDDAGLTLVELLVAMSLFLVAITMFGGSLYVMQRMQITDDQYSQANDQVHLALQTIDRQIRSGYVISVPVAPAGADAAVKIYTEAGGKPRCVMWVVANPAVQDPRLTVGTKSLYTTAWDPTGTDTTVPSTLQTFSAKSKYWILAASNLWNWLVVPGPVQPFTVTSGNTSILPTLNVAFRLNASTRSAATIEVASTYTSRNVPRQLEQIATTGTPTKASVCG
jgi:prepilin-type N-terminal cleavage/methylation domain-containing protein